MKNGRRRTPILGAGAAVAAVVVGLVVTSPASATASHSAVRRHPAVRHSGGYRLRFVDEHVPHHRRCRNTILNGVADSGEVIGTAYCGHHDEAFLQMPSGQQFRYRLPRRLASDTIASNIASDGSFVVIGAKRRNGAQTSYLVSANRRHRRTLRDPEADGHGTIVNGLNRHGAAVGLYCTTPSCRDEKPFVYRHHRFHAFHPRGLLLPTPSEINDNGEIAGFSYRDDGVAQGFVTQSDGTPYPISTPHQGTKPGTGDFIEGLSNSDVVVGVAQDDRHRLHGFVTYFDEYPATFVAKTPKHPKSFTELIGVNSSRVIVGRWYDAQHHTSRGLIATPTR